MLAPQWVPVLVLEHADCRVHQQLWLWQLLKSLGLPHARLWCSYEDLEMSSNRWAQVASLVDFFFITNFHKTLLKIIRSLVTHSSYNVTMWISAHISQISLGELPTAWEEPTCWTSHMLNEELYISKYGICKWATAGPSHHPAMPWTMHWPSWLLLQSARAWGQC